MAVIPSARTAVLLHTLPDGSSHLDWLLERPRHPSAPHHPDLRDAITFRVSARPDDPDTLHFLAWPLPDHRRLYLDYQGPVSGDRGTVVRLALGSLNNLHLDHQSLRATLLFPGSPPRTWRGQADSADAGPEKPWEFHLCKLGKD